MIPVQVEGGVTVKNFLRWLRRAFTLIEMLVVIAIIGILAGMLLPALNRTRHLAREKGCVSNLRQVYVALKLYADQHDGWFPVERTEHNPHDGLLRALSVSPSDLMMRAMYCPEGDLMEQSARNTTRYTPKGQSDSVIDTPGNNAAGNIGYIYWSFLANKPGWRNVSQFWPRLLHQSGSTPLKPGVKPAEITDTWLVSDWFRQGAPFPHTRNHAQGLNVLYLDGHVRLVLGSPKNSYK